MRRRVHDPLPQAVLEAHRRARRDAMDRGGEWKVIPAAEATKERLAREPRTTIELTRAQTEGSSLMTAEIDKSGFGEPRQDGTVKPGTFRGIFANCALALVRIAAALEQIASAMEKRP